MKKKLVLLLILVIVFLGYVGVRFFVLSRQDVYGQIKVTSTPPTSVFLDNAAIGKTPFEQKLKKGEYLLKLIPDRTATQTASWQGKIQIYTNALTYVNRELGATDIDSAGEIFSVIKMEHAPTNPNYGEIYVDTDPQGAIVNLDNDEKGVASLVMSDVLKGDHELSVYLPGFLRRTQKINVEAGYRVNASFKLAIDENQKSVTDLINQAKKESTSSASITPTSSGQVEVIILDTGYPPDQAVHWLRVRSEPSVTASESGKVNSGDKFPLIDEKEGWYEIKYNGVDTGWVYSQFAQKQGP